MYDYIIVGAGSAGCVLANRLSADPAARVLLVEAGIAYNGLEVSVPAGFSKLFKTAHDWDYSTEPQSEMNNRRMYWPRAKMVGGCSSMNAQIHARGNRLDYDHWAALGNNGWNYDAVLPYFRRSEDSSRGPSEQRGVGGELTIEELRTVNITTRAFIEAAHRAGIPQCVDVNSDCQDGVDYSQVTQRRGRRCSVATSHLAPALKRPNLTVLTGAQTTRIIIENGRATGIEYLRNGQRESARADLEVIVSGGAVNTPQLLMLSGIGAADQLRAHGIAVVHDLPGVGENLQDHLAASIIVDCKRPVTMIGAEAKLELAKYLLFKRGMLSSNVAEAIAFVRSSEDLDAPDVEIAFAPAPFIEHGLVKPVDHALTAGPILLTPKSVGRITLRSADPLDKPVIDPRYLTDADGHDLRVLRYGVRLARRIMASPALAKFVGRETKPGADSQTDAEIDQHIRQSGETLYHPVGTCRMGSDAEAVVDPELRVNGVDGLRVVDASVMPTIIRGHTNAPVIMIAEKAADLIKGAAR
jgi:choline dehydrogenase